MKMINLTAKNNKSLIFLTGFMGSGKSTIGPILANTLGYEYIDVDKFIENKVKKRIVDIFSIEGEQAFRNLERLTLQELIKFNHCVIALGGGTIANEDNFQLVSKNGILIYLKISPEEVIQRVKHRDDRPMLKDANGKQLSQPEMKQRIIELLERREPFYTRADVTIACDNMRIGVTIDEIIKNIRPLMEKE